MPRRTKPLPPHLSEYLLEKATPFLVYPKRDYKGAADTREVFDKMTRKFVGWRKTFQPRPADGLDEFFGQSTVLDQFYSRELLGAVPGLVQRTQGLRHLTLAGISDQATLAQLREAATCYLHGLFQACVALTRSAVEYCIRARAAEVLGKAAVEGLELKALLGRCGARFLCTASVDLAHSVRREGNRVLHAAAADSATALDVLEKGRTVILELSRQPMNRAGA